LHTPTVQPGLGPPLQTAPHEPQLFVSFCSFTQEPVQHVRPVPHEVPLTAVLALHAVVLAAGLQI
jgi:hypothetical protein